jgi:hypothetical protein
MEQWSSGVLEYWKRRNLRSTRIQLFALLHHSSTPTLQLMTIVSLT